MKKVLLILVIVAALTLGFRSTNTNEFSVDDKYGIESPEPRTF